MDFEEFEKLEGKIQTSKESSCSRAASSPMNPSVASIPVRIREKSESASANIAAQLENWEDYMDYGMGGRKNRDYFGFRLAKDTYTDK